MKSAENFLAGMFGLDWYVNSLLLSSVDDAIVDSNRVQDSKRYPRSHHRGIQV